MKKLFAIIILVSCTLVVKAQLQTVEKLFAVQPGATFENGYEGCVSISKIAASAQYINLSRFGGYKWSLGTVYNSNTFAIGLSTSSESSFTSPFFNITPTGNVGIGTTTPTSKLEINSMGLAPSPLLYGSYDRCNLVGNTDNANGFNIISTGSNRGVFKATRSRGTPSVPSTVANGDVVMTLIGSAFNGIGSYATAGINTLIDGSVTSSLIPQALTFETGTGTTRSERMRISSGGNVGIGTTNPGFSLDVQSNIITGMGRFQCTATTGSNRTGGVRAQTNTAMGDFLAIANNSNLPYASQDGVYIMNRTSNGNMYFTTNNNGTEAKVMSLTSTGRVGIGTANPQNKLDVNGTIRATEIKVVSPDSFPDYVFEKEYPLPTLIQVKQYIAENGHLQGIQSATEAKENGINLADMQVKLLQKVEELTLYAIDQQKKIEEQNKTVTEQQKRIENLERILSEKIH